MGRISVLAVDDQQVFADALQARLSLEEDLGPVSVAYTATEARSRLERRQYDIAIVDYGLGDDNGAQVSGELRMTAPSTRVIMLSALETIDTVAEALVAGVRAWLPKTIDGAYLVDAIRGVHAGEMWIDRRLLGQVMPALIGRFLTPPPDPLAALTSREKEVLECMIAGLSRAEIADRLHVSANTVRTHTQNLIGKLGVHSSLEAVTLALRNDRHERPL